jgi:hypothetical protein
MYDFVMRGPVGLQKIVDYLNRWAPTVSSFENSRVVRYEDIRSTPVAQLSEIIEFLDAPFSKEEVQEAVEFAEFENLKELERRNFFKNSRLTPRDPSDPDSFKVRRGVVGGYRDYFKDEEIAEMEALVATQLSAIYGYGDGSPEGPTSDGPPAGA